MKPIDSKYKAFIIWLIFGFIVLLLQSIRNPLFVLQEANYLAQPYDLRGAAKFGIYISVYLISIASIVFTILSRSKIVFILSLIWAGLTYAIDIFVQSLGAYRGFSIEEMSIVVSQFQLAGNMKVYSSEIILSILSAIIIAFIFLFIRKASTLRYGSILGIVCFILGVIGSKYASNNIYSVLHNSFPAPIKTLAIGFDYINQVNEIANRKLSDEIVPTKIDSTKKNIVWIIDESATGSYLSINGYKKATTPYLDQAIIENENLVNLGITNSISNCSNTSNLYLRIGMHPKRDFNQLNNLPSIISFAKKAGYKVVMLDAQITDGEMTNFITNDEIRMLDKINVLDRTVKPHDRDQQMNKILFNLLDNSPVKLFVIYIKFGCHWPYLLSFDNQNIIFSPVQSSTATRMIKRNKELIENTYLNALYHNVDLFFKELIKNVDPFKNFVFYTSDHGQSILETESARTHCSSNIKDIPLKEFDVPLLIYTSGIDSLYRSGGYSQIQMFPSTLKLMGYEENYVKEYGKSLEQGPLEERYSFITGTGKMVKF